MSLSFTTNSSYIADLNTAIKQSAIKGDGN
jgi:hypothetical protein